MRMYNGRPRKKYVTGNIGSLAQDEVFVFGSNLDGFLGGGAAPCRIQQVRSRMGQGGRASRAELCHSYNAWRTGRN